MTNFGTGTIWKWILAHILPFLLPEAAAADAGKVVSVNSEGDYTLSTTPSFSGGTVSNATTFESQVTCEGGLRDGRVNYTPPANRNDYVTKQYVDSKEPVNLKITLPVGTRNSTVTLDADTLAELNKNSGKRVRVHLNTTINGTGPHLTLESEINIGTGGASTFTNLYATPLDTINLDDYVTMLYSYADGNITNISFRYEVDITMATSLFITREECTQVSPDIDT